MTKTIYRVMAALTAVIVAAALVKGADLAGITAGFPEGETTEITEITARSWTKLEDGTGVAYTIPEGHSDAQILEITCNWISMEVYLEDELLYSFSDEYQEMGRASHWIEIPAGSDGKRIIFKSDSDAALVEATLQGSNYIGKADAIRHHFFMKNLPVLFLVIVDVMMAGVVLLIWLVLRRKLTIGLIRSMRDLFCFIVLNGIWLLSDSGLPQCFTTQTGLWALISYISFMLIPVFMLRFAQRLLTYRRKSLRVLGMGSLGLTSATLILYATRIAPLSTLLPFHQSLLVIDFVVIFVLCDYESRHYRIKRLEPICNGVVLMGLFVAATILSYWKGLTTLYSLLFDAGFICYIVCLLLSVVQQVYDNLGKKAEMETYRKLAYKDVMTMVYNRSAFIEYQQGAGAAVQNAAYILFDVNSLKLVNDTKGHQAGDDLIMRAAACIRETFDGVGRCYRIGGDEFMVVLDNVRSKKEVLKLLEHFDKQVWLSNKELNKNQPSLSVAYGFSVAGKETRTGEELYKEADEWMYSRKRNMKQSMKAVG